MMNELIMPKAPTRIGIERQQAIGKQVLTDAISAPKIKGSRSGRDEYHATRLIEAHSRPTVDSTDVGPRIRGPRIGTLFSRIGQGVKSPNDLSGANIVSANMSRRRRSGTFSHAHRKKQQIAENSTWGR